MGSLAIMNKEGDTKVIWDSNNTDEVEAAETQFNMLIKKGFMAFEVGTKGKKTNIQVMEFDPDLEKIIMVPPIVGG